MSDFSHILNWKLLRGSHEFPGPQGGTCINEAAVVACGFPYQRVASVAAMPDCFSRSICRLAMQLNDNATDTQRQLLMPFVTRLACADKPEVEREREQHINARLELDPLYSAAVDFDKGLGVLEGALAIGQQADPLGFEEAASRLDAARGTAMPKRKTVSLLPLKMKKWLGLSQALQNAE